MLAFYKQLYGPQILLQLNTAYFLPSIPILLIQTQWDAQINRSLGIATATACRLFVGEPILLSSTDMLHNDQARS